MIIYSLNHVHDYNVTSGPPSLLYFRDHTIHKFHKEPLDGVIRRLYRARVVSYKKSCL